MTFKICLCGTQPGYPHAFDCPYPLYISKPSQSDYIKWNTQRNIIRMNVMEALDALDEEESAIEYHDYHDERKNKS
jgi:hypothetical protein